nr:gamma-glutamylcyclotransferase [uncultured Draconibacterium sp.]
MGKCNFNRLLTLCAKRGRLPGNYQKNNSTVKGKVLLNLDENVIYLLTFYEGDEYGTAPVKVETNSGIVNAVAFVWKAGNEFLEDFDWDEDQFKSESLAFYRDEIVPATREEYHRRD